MLCSEVFVAGRKPDAALADLVVDDLTLLRFTDTFIDRTKGTVTVSWNGLTEREARYRSGVGCTTFFREVEPASRDSRARRTEDGSTYTLNKTRKAIEAAPVGGTEKPQLAAVIEDAFSEPNPEHPRRTRAVVVMHKGHIVAERYAPGVGPDTPLLGWSMAKKKLSYNTPHRQDQFTSKLR